MVLGLGLVLEAVGGGVDKALGRELWRLSSELHNARSMEQLGTQLLSLKEYLKDCCEY